jgi:hypothetical protein
MVASHTFAAALAISLCASAQKPPLQTATIGEAFYVHYHVLGKGYVLSVDDDQLRTSPSWPRPGSKQPPLPIKRAIRLSELALGKYVSDPKLWRVGEISLHSIGQESKWFYLIEWYPTSPGHIGDGFSFVVLMNGALVEPKVEIETTP